MQSRPLKCVLLTALLFSGSAGAIDTVKAFGIAGSRATCERAGMVAKITALPSERAYRVVCVDKPPAFILQHNTTGKAVAHCVRSSMNVLVEGQGDNIRVSCIVP